MIKKQRDALYRLRTLCCSGFNTVSIAPDIFHHVHKILPNEACALFLTDPLGMPYMFYHEDSPENARALFQNEPQLFMGRHEYNIFKIATAPIKSGYFLHPDEEYFSSHTYQHLVRASGHHHTLEVRLEVLSKAAGALLLFREPSSKPFQSADLPHIHQIARYIEYSLNTDSIEQAFLSPIETEQALIMVSPDTQEIQFSTLAAELMLKEIPLIHNLWQTGKPLPIICTQLIQQLCHGSQLPETTVKIPSGHLYVRAEWLNAQQSTHRLIVLHLKKFMPRSLMLWQFLQKTDLNAQQASVAFLLLTGLSKNMIQTQLSISEAVVKDCIKSIYQYFSVHSLDELIKFLYYQANLGIYSGIPVQ
jgi:DNA-binding CsgD family transcriptional regulator